MWGYPFIATGSGEDDWIQKLRRHPPRKEDVIVALMKMMRQLAALSEKKPGDIRSKEPRDFDHHGARAPDECQGDRVGKQG